MRTRFAYQAIPADHPAVLDMAMRAAPIPEPALAALREFEEGWAEDGSVLDRMQVLHVRTSPDDPTEAGLVCRTIDTGQLASIGWNRKGDDVAYGCTLEGGVEAFIARMGGRLDETARRDLARLADAPWVDPQGKAG